MLDSCIAAVLASLRSEVADFGATVAIDGSDLPAYANGQRFLFNHGPERQKFSVLTLPGDTVPLSRRARAAGSTGTEVTPTLYVTTGMPLSWETHTARDAEVPVVASLLDALAADGIRPSVRIADKG